MWFKSSEIFRVLGVQMASEVAGRGRSLFRTEGLPLPLIHGFFFEVPQGHQLPGNKALVEGRYKLGQGQWVKNPLYPDGGKWENPMYDMYDIFIHICHTNQPSRV